MIQLKLTRLAGSPPPRIDAVRRALLGQWWLRHEPADGHSSEGIFRFAGGGLYPVTSPASETPYVAPWLHAWVVEDAEFASTARCLVLLARELALGLDIGSDGDGLWWEPPFDLSERTLRAAIAVAAPHAAGVEPAAVEDAWVLLGFALLGAECQALAESHTDVALALARGRWRDPDLRRFPAASRRDLQRHLATLPAPKIAERWVRVDGTR